MCIHKLREPKRSFAAAARMRLRAQSCRRRRRRCGAVPAAARARSRVIVCIKSRCVYQPARFKLQHTCMRVYHCCVHVYIVHTKYIVSRVGAFAYVHTNTT